MRFLWFRIWSHTRWLLRNRSQDVFLYEPIPPEDIERARQLAIERGWAGDECKSDGIGCPCGWPSQPCQADAAKKGNT